MERHELSASGSRFLHGGNAEPVPLSAVERRALEALIDTLIPPEDGWPPAADLGVTDVVARYVVPAGQQLSLYPHVREQELRERLVGWSRELVGRDDGERIAVLQAFEADDPTAFARWRDLAYYCFYGTRAVVLHLQRTSTYGSSYRGAPQPEGYVDVLAGWGDRRPPARGVFIPTEQVRRATAAEVR